MNKKKREEWEREGRVYIIIGVIGMIRSASLIFSKGFLEKEGDD